MFNRKLFVTIKRPLLWLKARLSRRFESRFYDALFAMLAKLCHADGESNGATLDVVSAFISAEIKSRYRHLAKRYHPDSHAHSDMPAEVLAFCETRFRELQVAYDLIQKSRADETTP